MNFGIPETGSSRFIATNILLFTMYSILSTIVFRMGYIENTFELFHSEARKKILQLFFVSSKKEYYVRELAKILKLLPGNVHRELTNLKRAGIVSSRKIGNVKLFYLNENNPLLPELTGLINKTIGIPAILAKLVDKYPNISNAFVYGSYAKGNFDSSSDVDLFVSASSAKIYDKINAGIAKIENKIQREINLDFMTDKELKEKIKKNDPYIKDVLKGQKVILRGGEIDLGSKRGAKTSR